MNIEDTFILMEPNERALLFAASTLPITRFRLKALEERSKSALFSNGHINNKSDIKHEINVAVNTLVNKNLFETCIIDTETRYSISSLGYTVCAYIREQAAKQTDKINPKIRAISHA